MYNNVLSKVICSLLKRKNWQTFFLTFSQRKFVYNLDWQKCSNLDSNRNFLEKKKSLLPTSKWEGSCKILEKSKEHILSKTETCQFCTQKRPKRGLLSMVKIVITLKFRKSLTDFVKFLFFAFSCPKTPNIPYSGQNIRKIQNRQFYPPLSSDTISARPNEQI